MAITYAVWFRSNPSTSKLFIKAVSRKEAIAEYAKRHFVEVSSYIAAKKV